VDLEVRPIRPDDKARLQAGLEGLSVESARLRFLTAKNSLSSTELRYLTEVDHENHLALVAESGDRIVGVIRSVRDPERPDTAEVAYVVADDFQRRGLGTLLLRDLARLAAQKGIHRFTATMNGENTAAKRLLLTLGEPEYETWAGGTREMAVALPRPRTPRRPRDRTGSRRSAGAPRQRA
jgi:RimJ/RimL family protein N-acetyltransferase